MSGTPPRLPVLDFTWADGPAPDEALAREWLVTNGRGGYAAGTVAFSPSRKYHGLFIPNLPSGRGRTVLLGRVEETVEASGQVFRLDVEERANGERDTAALPLLRAFRLRGLVPEWEYQVGPSRLRRRLVMVHGENRVVVAYDLLEGPQVRLGLRPFPVNRNHERLLPDAAPPPAPTVHARNGDVEVRFDKDAAPLRMRFVAPNAEPFLQEPTLSGALLFRWEQERGYEHVETQHGVGRFVCALHAGQSAWLSLTCDDGASLDEDEPPELAFTREAAREEALLEKAPPAAREGTGARLVLASDQFLIEPAGRTRASRSVIAGYPWFTDWGRDTMISLEGLTLSTGRQPEGGAILRTFQQYVRDGLLPNLFPDGANEGLYHTADATLWFFHAIDRYLETSGDAAFLGEVFPTLEDIVRHHLRGTRFNIRVDPEDGLLAQGEDGYQLTWMDAKVDGWVVTPRRGKPVELSALWFNALCLMADWARALGKDASQFRQHADRAQASFNDRFWNPNTGCLFDVVDGEGGGNDGAVRPNQIFALSLRHPVLREERWQAVVSVVERELLTPVGLRSLAPGHPDFQPTYAGNLRARDAAYHQGTVWSWLLGHFVDAKLRVDPDRTKARGLLEGLVRHLGEAGVGQVSEIFDATSPFTPRGCFAQAWGTAELLRCWLRTAPGQSPHGARIFAPCG